MAQRNLAKFYDRFSRRTDELLNDCLTSPPILPIMIGETPVDRLLLYSQGFLVNRLFHLWGELCRSLVEASAIGGYSTLGGHAITRAPNIKYKSDIPKLINVRSLAGPGLKWEDPAWTSKRIDTLQLANGQQLKLGIAAAPYEDFRRVRNFIIHTNPHTRGQFENVANRFLLFGVEPEVLLQYRVRGGGTLMETWVRQFQIAALNAVQ